jgi:hypothetical protein
MEIAHRQRWRISLLHAAVLLALAINPSRGDEVPKYDPENVEIKVWNGTEPCFTFQNTEFKIDQIKITVSFIYNSVDNKNVGGNASNSECSCDRSPFSSRAGFRVFAHGDKNFASVRDTSSIIDGELTNIPDLEKFNSAKIPRNGFYDLLPKAEKIEFPVQYINGRPAIFYLVEIWCG